MLRVLVLGTELRFSGRAASIPPASVFFLLYVWFVDIRCYSTLGWVTCPSCTELSLSVIRHLVWWRCFWALYSPFLYAYLIFHQHHKLLIVSFMS